LRGRVSWLQRMMIWWRVPVMALWMFVVGPRRLLARDAARDDEPTLRELDVAASMPEFRFTNPSGGFPMAMYVLIPGAASGPWYWHLLEHELAQRGQDAVAVDIPCDDDSAGLAEYADAVVRAIGDRGDVILVAHSFGGFTAPLVCERVPVRLLVMLQAQVPAPGESPGEWWATTGHEQARKEQDERDGDAPADEVALFMHQTAPELATELRKYGRSQTGTPFMKPWPLDEWPAVPTKFLLARDDKFFPAQWLRTIVRDRLGIEPDEMPGDHNPMLSHPKELADRLEAYRSELL
jgi:pimeloyl-ACP methyl ester carboxylesterase